MSEQEQYLKYIAAHRSRNKEEVEKMLSEGFRPDRQRLIELAQNDKAIREALFNKKITVRIDVGHLVGHIYGDFPYYDEVQNKIIESSFGYYPEKEGFPKAILGSGVVRDEIHESGRAVEPLSRQEVSLPVTEEAWIKLAYWITEKRKDKSYYLLIGQNCSYFVDRALKEAGYTDGLMDKFDPAKIQDLDFGLIKLDVLRYLRYDKREIYQPQSQVPIMGSRSEELQSGMVKHLSEKAKEERSQSNKQSHTNQVNAFFDKYHEINFYKTYFKDKPLKVEDIHWFVRNDIPGIERKNRSAIVLPQPASNQAVSAPSLFFSDKQWVVEKQKQVDALKQQVARKQSLMQSSKIALSHKSDVGLVKQEKMLRVYNCPPFYADLPLFKAMGLGKPKPVPSGGLKIMFVD